MIAVMAESLGDNFDELAAYLMPSLLELSGRGKKVMSDYSATAIAAVADHCKGPATLAAVLGVVTAEKRPSPPVALQCARFIRAAVECWPLPTVQPQLAQICASVEASLRAKSADARADARKAFQVRHGKQRKWTKNGVFTIPSPTLLHLMCETAKNGACFRCRHSASVAQRRHNR